MVGQRFDDIARTFGAGPSRRTILRGLAVLGIGGGLARPVARSVAAKSDCFDIGCPSDQCTVMVCWPDGVCTCSCRNCKDVTGIAGGGQVLTGIGHESHLALLATRTALTEQPNAFAVVGQVRWVDPAWEGLGLALESTFVASYGPLPDVEGGREVVGWLRTDQRPGEYPFVLRAVDAGPPGSGLDTVALWVGDAVLDDPVAGALDPAPVPSGFRYRAEGTLVTGDLQLVSLASSTAAAGTSTAPTS